MMPFRRNDDEDDDSLLSPQMRKWLRGAKKHGKSVYLRRYAGGRPSRYRITDTLDFRVTDGWDSQLSTALSFVRIIN